MDYGYDNLDQLLSATGYESPSLVQRRNEKLSYSYDAAGNLTQRVNDALTEVFGQSANRLNQFSTVTSSGTLTVAGLTSGGATSVTVGDGVSPYNDGSFAVPGKSRPVHTRPPRKTAPGGSPRTRSSRPWPAPSVSPTTARAI